MESGRENDSISLIFNSLRPNGIGVKMSQKIVDFRLNVNIGQTDKL